MCFRCLNTFHSEKSLASHHEYCKSYKAIKLNLPKRDRKYLVKITIGPFIVYADFKSFTPHLSICQPNPEKSYTNKYQKHIPSGFWCHITCIDDTLYSQQSVTLVKEFNDDDVAQIFIDTLEENIKENYKKCKFSKSMIMTMQDKLIYDNSTLCHICNEEIGKDSVRDHCHLSGKFRGTAHEVWNQKYKVPTFFPVVFHNLSGYDCHYILEHWEIAKEIFLVFHIIKKTTFLSRSRSLLTNVLIRKEKR